MDGVDSGHTQVDDTAPADTEDTCVSCHDDDEEEDYNNLIYETSGFLMDGNIMRMCKYLADYITNS